jgi:hypothetical protein
MEDGLLAPIAEVEGLPRPWSPVWVGWQVAKNYFKTFLRQEDADFVAHARDDIPWLMAQLHAIQIATQELQQALETFDNNVTDAEHDPTLEMAVFRAAREVVRKTSLLPK